MTNYPNNWIPTKNLEQMESTIYDYLIIGSGIGGGVTLNRLCELWKNENTIRIGMIERGNKLFYSNSLNIPTINDTRMFGQLFPDNSSPIGDNLPELPGAREVYALGGRTLFWNGVSPRPSQHQLDSWPIHSRELDLYYSLAEKAMDVTPFYAQGSSIQTVLLDRLYANGYLEATALPIAIDMNGTRLGKINTNSWYSTINSLATALFYKPFDLALNSFVSSVLIENGQVIGVTALSTDKTPYFIRAKNVILAASALENPRILLNSKIDNDSIGRYLTNHSNTFSMAEISRDQFNEELGNLSILLPEQLDEPYQIQILGPNPYFSYPRFQEKLFKNNLLIILTAFGIIESRPENRVFLDSSSLDEYGIHTIKVDFTLSDKDREISQQMINRVIHSSSAIGAELTKSSIDLDPFGSDYHESCTCRMGLDPDTSVVDSNSMVHGIQGLYIAGNSVLPSLPAANPTLSSAALAIRLADHLAHALTF